MGMSVAAVSTGRVPTGVLPVQGAGWPVSVHGCFTTRAGGVSQAPFDTWNLGDHVGDQPERVRLNRLRLGECTAAQPVFLQQVHGTAVVELTHETPDGTVADACWTREPGIACTVMVADCLPLLLCDASGRSVAAVHAGWRGLAGAGGLGVIESLCAQWPAAQTPADRAGLRVWLGPCIGPQAFEVGAEVRQAFLEHDPGAVHCFARALASRDETKWLAHLPGLARRRLQALGIQCISGNDGTPSWCTLTQGSLFFSHRRDAVRLGSTGRMAASIWVATVG